MRPSCRSHQSWRPVADDRLQPSKLKLPSPSAEKSRTELQQALYAAVECADFEFAKRLLESTRVKPDVVVAGTGITAVHLAAGLGNSDLLRLLLDHQADPNCRCAEGGTPLHVAAAWGQTEKLELLLASGADTELRDGDGFTALELAERHGHQEAEARLKAAAATQPQADEPAEFTLTLERLEVSCDETETVKDCTEEATELLGDLQIASGGVEKRVADWCNLQHSPEKGPPSLPSSSSDCTEFHSCVSRLSQRSRVSLLMRYKDPEVTLFERRTAGSMGNHGSCGELKQALSQEDLGSCSSLSSLASEAGYETEVLRKELNALGHPPGPITQSTKRIYIRHLRRLQRCPHDPSPPRADRPRFSRELEKSIRAGVDYDSSPADALERQMALDFADARGRRWRQGETKHSFTYLLLDPRITCDLPQRANSLQPDEAWLTFLRSIFYVGQGRRSRPYAHLHEAFNVWSCKKRSQKNLNKVERILEIWAEGAGVVCLHLFQGTLAVEAFTREAAMIEALGLSNLTNAKGGEFYGKMAAKGYDERRLLGVGLLRKAMRIFLLEGERQLRPDDFF